MQTHTKKEKSSQVEGTKMLSWRIKEWCLEIGFWQSKTKVKRKYFYQECEWISPCDATPPVKEILSLKCQKLSESVIQSCDW